MNRLKGRIRKIEADGPVLQITLQWEAPAPEGLASGFLSAILLEGDSAASRYEIDEEVEFLFKETEVALAKGPFAAVQGLPITIRNRLPCRVREIRRGGILTHVILSLVAPSGSLEPSSRRTAPPAEDRFLHALVSTASVEALNLSAGDEAAALVKATEVSLSKGPTL